MAQENKLLILSTILAVCSFIIALYFEKIWLALFLALIIAVVFMARLLKMSKQSFKTKASYRFFYITIISLTLFHAISFAHDYGMRDYQEELLLDIRKTIDTGITKVEIQQKLIYVLQVYHTEERDSIVDTFFDIMSNNISKNGVYLTDLEVEENALNSNDKTNDNINYFFEVNEQKDEVRFNVVTDISVGEDSNYKNFDGQTGRVEMMFVLNKKGVEYEVLN